MGTSDYFITIGGKKYALDVQKILDFCLKDGKSASTEKEITEAYEATDGGVELSNRIERELVGNIGNTNNDTITYDFIKFLLGPIFDVSSAICDVPTVSASLAFNTMIKMGFIYEITE